MDPCARVWMRRSFGMWNEWDVMSGRVRVASVFHCEAHERSAVLEGFRDERPRSSQWRVFVLVLRPRKDLPCGKTFGVSRALDASRGDQPVARLRFDVGFLGVVNKTLFQIVYVVSLLEDDGFDEGWEEVMYGDGKRRVPPAVKVRHAKSFEGLDGRTFKVVVSPSVVRRSECEKVRVEDNN